MADRFWSKVRKEASGCWEWQGATNLANRGYGAFRIDGKARGAHVVSLYLATGAWPKLDVCHRCDNPLCVNPDHLFEGTARDNAQDALRKGRLVSNPPRGERARHAKLTPDAVRMIRAKHEAGENMSALARSLGVSRSAISNVTDGRAWRHLDSGAR